MIEGEMPETGQVALIAPHQENGYNTNDFNSVRKYLIEFSTVIATLNGLSVQYHDEKIQPPDLEQTISIEMIPEAKKIIQDSNLKFRVVL